MGKSTQTFKKRHSGHKQEVKNQIGGLGRHHGGNSGCGYDQMSIQIIDQVKHGDDEALAKCETFLQKGKKQGPEFDPAQTKLVDYETIVLKCYVSDYEEISRQRPKLPFLLFKF